VTKSRMVTARTRKVSPISRDMPKIIFKKPPEPP
jgi:hypothetical protein